MIDNEFKSMLMIFRQASLEIASEEHACNPKLYLEEKVKGVLKSPLTGHCTVVSYLIYKIFGGKVVCGRIDGQSHYWNRLPDGTEVDLTSCQFGGDGITPLKKGRAIARKFDLELSKSPTSLRALLFCSLVRDKVEGNTR